MHLDQVPTLLVYGGGRWSRQVVTVLLGMELPFQKVLIVSKINAAAMHSLINDAKEQNNCEYSIIPDLKLIRETKNIRAALIVSSARTHMRVAQELISLGIDVFVEKPLALKKEDAALLIQSAKAAEVNLYLGLQYRFCSYIHNFAAYLKSINETATDFLLLWSDASNEKRYGEVKTYDYSLNVAEDIMPHIWSILDTIFKGQNFSISKCAIESGGRVAKFEIQSADLTGTIVLERESSVRQRIFEVIFDSGRACSIDFSSEPGTLTDIEGREWSADTEWTQQSRPLAKQLKHFFKLEQFNINQLTSDAILDSVAFCENAAIKIKSLQKESLKSAIRNNNLLKEHRLELREVLADDLIREGLVIVSDNVDLEEKTQKIWELISHNKIQSIKALLQRLELI